MVKPKSQQAGEKKQINLQKAEEIAERLADKPYGQEVNRNLNDAQIKDDNVRITISLPASLRDSLDDLAMQRKRRRLPNRTVSSIVQEALGSFFKQA